MALQAKQHATKLAGVGRDPVKPLSVSAQVASIGPSCEFAGNLVLVDGLVGAAPRVCVGRNSSFGCFFFLSSYPRIHPVVKRNEEGTRVILSFWRVHV